MFDQRLWEADFPNHLWLLNDSAHENSASQGPCTHAFMGWMSSIHSTPKIPFSENKTFPHKILIALQTTFCSSAAFCFCVSSTCLMPWDTCWLNSLNPLINLEHQKQQLSLVDLRRVSTCVSTRCIFISAECRQCHNRRDGSFLELLKHKDSWNMISNLWFWQ